MAEEISPGIAAAGVTMKGQLPEERSNGVLPTRVATESATAQEREAILNSLHAERGHLTRARRLNGLSEAEAEYLTELEACIDHWEAAEAREADAADDVWGRLNEIGRSLLSVQAGIEQQRR